MKITTILLLIAILTHQIILPAVNSILLMELFLLGLFIVVVAPKYKEYKRKRQLRKHLFQIRSSYKSKSEPKTWRGRTQTEVTVNRKDFIDSL